MNIRRYSVRRYSVGIPTQRVYMLDINIIIIQNLSGNLYFCDNCFFIATPICIFPRKFPLETEISSELQLTGSRLLPSGIIPLFAI